jgi:hypothetical protein
MGHNFGRRHAPCGTSSGLGPYPYGSGAPIGQWGYSIEGQEWYSPTDYRDYMSYCGPEWTSDFTYRAIFDAWDWVSAPYGAAAGAAAVEAYLISGYVNDQGALVANAPFFARVPAARLAGAGPYRAELLDSRGQIVAATSFSVTPIVLDYQGPGGQGGHGEERQGFLVTVPATGTGTRLRLASPGGGPAVEFSVAGLTPTNPP